MQRAIGIVLLLLGLVQLGYHEWQRIYDVPAFDFDPLYSAARTWLHGGDPYDQPAIVETWRHAGWFPDRDASYFATVYPPSSLITVMPWAALRAGLAMACWMMLILILLAVQFRVLPEMAGLKTDDPRRLILLGASLASAPYQTGILAGNPSIPTISLSIIAFWCAGKQRDKLGGVLLGLACALKPQIAAPFVLYYLVLRRFNIVAFAAMVGAAIWGIALAGMVATHIHWIDGWRAGIAATTKLGAVNYYGWTNWRGDAIVDLRILFVGITSNPKLQQAGIAMITILLFICYLSWFGSVGKRASRTSRDELLVLAGLSAICMLPVYHRLYDVALLATALAWGLAEVNGPRRSYAILLLLAMTPFLIPRDSVRLMGYRVYHLYYLVSFRQNGVRPRLFIPLYAWELLALTIVLLLVMRKCTAEADGGPKACP